MHKDFYASGFLYHLPSQQILLQQLNESSAWSLFSGDNNSSEDPIEALQRIIHEHLGIKLKSNRIHPVYDYFHQLLGRKHYMMYVEVDTVRTKFALKKGAVVAWFTSKQILKIPLSDQTKQDIIIAERVIKAQARSLEPQVKNPNQQM